MVCLGSRWVSYYQSPRLFSIDWSGNHNARLYVSMLCLFLCERLSDCRCSYLYLLTSSPISSSRFQVWWCVESIFYSDLFYRESMRWVIQTHWRQAQADYLLSLLHVLVSWSTSLPFRSRLYVIRVVVVGRSESCHSAGSYILRISDRCKHFVRYEGSCTVIAITLSSLLLFMRYAFSSKWW